MDKGTKLTGVIGHINKDREKEFDENKKSDITGVSLKSSVVLKFVVDLLKRYEGETDYNIYITKEWLLEIKQTLQRLEAIDKAKPSEALEYVNSFLNETINCLENPKQYAKDYSKEIFYKYKYTLETTIKQALLKAQEQEKVLKIIKEKNVNTLLLELAENLEEYNERIVPNGKLTQEEFELLKRCVDNE